MTSRHVLRTQIHVFIIECRMTRRMGQMSSWHAAHLRRDYKTNFTLAPTCGARLLWVFECVHKNVTKAVKMLEVSVRFSRQIGEHKMRSFHGSWRWYNLLRLPAFSLVYKFPTFRGPSVTSSSVISVPSSGGRDLPSSVLIFNQLTVLIAREVFINTWTFLYV
jgi:hypothetical protein